jgi:serine/threonine-protein kinase
MLFAGGMLDPANKARVLTQAQTPVVEAVAAAPADSKSEPSTSALPRTRSIVNGEPMPLPGDIIDGYEIQSEIGRGGMGRVYHATHTVTGQEVALKMLLPHLSADRRVRGRFFNEARVLAKLEHPSLVPLLGFIESGARAFIVMPLVKGETLDKRLRRDGRMPLDVVARLFEPMCAALEHVHSHDLLHRDLKPSNIIIRSDDRPVITDFGIARAIGAEKVTLPGMVVGTAEYLAPEQASGVSRDDKRSDVYSLGVLLYEMVTGRVPFEHPNAGEVLQRHVNALPPPPRLIVPSLSEAVEAVILRALEKRPDARFPSAAALGQAAVEALTTGAPPAPPSASLTPAPPPVQPGLTTAELASLSDVAPPVSHTGDRPFVRLALFLLGLAALGAALGAGLKWLSK